MPYALTAALSVAGSHHGSPTGLVEVIVSAQRYGTYGEYGCPDAGCNVTAGCAPALKWHA
eukprot:1369917-Prymnesium_polylepis.1